MRAAFRNEAPDRSVLDVIDIEDWAEFARTSERIILHFEGRTLERNDGPDGARSWFVRFSRTVLVFDLVDMVGMQISGEGDSARELIKKIEGYLECVGA